MVAFKGCEDTLEQKGSGLLGSSGVPRESPLAAPGVTGPALEFQEVDRVSGPPLSLLLRLWLAVTAAQEVRFAFRAEAEAGSACPPPSKLSAGPRPPSATCMRWGRDVGSRSRRDSAPGTALSCTDSARSCC